MKKASFIIWFAALALLLTALPPPAAAAPFDPTVLKISVDDSLWQRYHIGPEPVSGDIVKLYRIKKAEVVIFSGNREFASHAFTPRDDKPYKIVIPHGVPNIKIHLKTWTADGVSWTTVIDHKDTGDNLVIRAVPVSLSICSPGI